MSHRYDAFDGIRQDVFFTAQWPRHNAMDRWRQWPRRNTLGFTTPVLTQIARFMGPTWGPPGFCRPHMGPLLDPRTLLSEKDITAVLRSRWRRWSGFVQRATCSTKSIIAIPGTGRRGRPTHDDVIKSKHFPRHWLFVRGIQRYKRQWRGALMFYLICPWTNNWANNGDASDLRRHRAHYDVIVMNTWSESVKNDAREISSQGFI